MMGVTVSCSLASSPGNSFLDLFFLQVPTIPDAYGLSFLFRVACWAVCSAIYVRVQKGDSSVNLFCEDELMVV